MKLRGRKRWWLLAAGAIGGLGDTALALWLGIDFTVAGRDLTLPVAAFLSSNMAFMCFLMGYYMDAREQARADAGTIGRQLRELEATQRAVAQNEKLAAIGRLAAGVAHEVRNPLGVIRASASMVQESFDPEDEPYRACAFICEESDRLNGLITSLLAFARPTEPNRERVALEKIVDRALHIAARDLEQREIQVVRESMGGVPELDADPDLLAQAVFDLVTNAMEAVVPGGRIALRARAEPRGALLEVADDGPGVSLEDAEQVFEPFFTTKTTGTGLGLAMTARIIESHGGQVEVVQGAGAGVGGRGACFRLRLPVGGSLAGPDVVIGTRA